MNNIQHHLIVKDAVKGKFRGNKALRGKTTPMYPDSAEREFRRIANAYMRLLNQTLKEHLPDMMAAYKRERHGDSRFDDAQDLDMEVRQELMKVAQELEKKLAAYSAQEMRASRLAGKSLDARKAESARLAIDTKNNQIAWRGDEESGLMGVLSTGQNIPLFTITANASGKTKWTEKSADEILADVNGMAKQVAKVTKNVERPDTLCVPAEVYMDISTRRIPDTTATVLSFILEHAPYIKNVVSAAELDADSVETNPYALEENGQGVAFLFKNDKRKLSLEIPMLFYQYPAQVRNLETVIPCEARTAGVIVYYPLSALIAVGVC